MKSNPPAGVLTAMFASSRPLQSTLSIAQPLFAAFLAVGGFPQLPALLLLVVGSAAGLYAVFSLNDLLDYELDKKTAAVGAGRGWDIDAIFARHPVTAGLISVNQQVAWIAAMAIVAIAVLYALSPLALGLFFVAVLLEGIYCRLAMVTEFKFVFAGAVVAVGALIGWFAAGGVIEPITLMLLGMIFFAWEVGGRNIPNDFSDIKQDRALGVKTLACVYGPVASTTLIQLFALITLVANAALGLYASLGPAYLIASTAAGAALLLFPSVNLAKNRTPAGALDYFNKASLYPAFLLLSLALAYALKTLG